MAKTLEELSLEWAPLSGWDCHVALQAYWVPSPGIGQWIDREKVGYNDSAILAIVTGTLAEAGVSILARDGWWSARGPVGFDEVGANVSDYHSVRDAYAACVLAAAIKVKS